MPKRTHSKKYPPKGLPIDGFGGKSKNKKILGIKDPHLPQNGLSHLTGTDRASWNSFLISRAYSEPNGYDMVENMLLQRDYIID